MVTSDDIMDIIMSSPNKQCDLYHVPTWVFEELYFFSQKSQSAYRQSHSMESVLMKVLANFTNAVDDDQLALIAFLDLSAAFDTVDHHIIKNLLRITFVLSDLQWFPVCHRIILTCVGHSKEVTRRSFGGLF